MFWLDGDLVAPGRAPFELGDRGLTLGDGVFDTSLVVAGRAFQEEAHLVRLEAALAALAIEIDGRRIRACVRDLCAEAAQAGGRHALRVTVTRGAGLRGLVPAGPGRPVVIGALSALAADPFGPALRAEVASIRRNETSPCSRLKTLSYLDAILALREAATRGRNEALFLNGAGRVACGSVGNVFALFGDELVTPPAREGVLPGIIRAFLLREAETLRLRAREGALSLDALLTADAAFLTNSLRLIAPIESVDGLAIAGRGGKIVAALQDLLRRAIEDECGAPP